MGVGKREKEGGERSAIPKFGGYCTVQWTMTTRRFDPVSAGAWDASTVIHGALSDHLSALIGFVLFFHPVEEEEHRSGRRREKRKRGRRTGTKQGGDGRSVLILPI